ncbi:MAG TPA: SDR family oxidoreductase [Blastocatellia bacterium]|nr:SDR family oxidoreductase [Blastocatellia bacterium]
MNLVVGATGFLGSDICRLLVQQGQPVRALVRTTSDPAKKAALQSLGIELVTGDLKDPASLAAACQGVSAVITTASVTISRQPDDSIQAVDLDGQLHLLEAAKAAQVGQFIYISYSANIDVDCPLKTAKRTVEQAVQESGMTYTILRPSSFMEVWLSPIVGFDAAQANATVYGTGEQKISWISLHDVTRFAVASLTNPAARNAVLELGGPEALSPLEVIKIFESVSGKTFTVQYVPAEALQAQLAAATDPIQQSVAALMLAVTQGDEIDMRETAEKFSLSLLSVEAFARQALAA